MTIKKGKGSNPNSHGNKPRLGEGAIAKGVTLAPKQWDVASEIGDGNYSLGIRRLVDLALSIGAIDSEKLFQRLPALGKSKLALQLLLEKYPKAEEYAEIVLAELEDLEIEQLYKEAIADGDINPPKGAWIA